MSSLRSRSRSPIRFEKKSEGDIQELFLANLPLNWNFPKIKKFIFQNIQAKIVHDGLKYIKILKTDDQRPKGACLISFDNPIACNIALKGLSGLECMGKKLIAMYDPGTLQQRISKQLGMKEHHTAETQSTQRPNQSKHELYGLSVNFLQSLNINPPLTNIIFVSQVDHDTDKSLLRDIFSMAGQILSMNIYTKEPPLKSYARIEYDHPVEAVQAISMFHNKQINGSFIKVKLDESPMSYVRSQSLGMISVGPGLGVNGEPLRAVRISMEMDSLKKMLLQEILNLKQTVQNLEQNKCTHNQEEPSTSSSNTPNNTNFNMQPTTNNLFNPQNQMASLQALNLFNSQLPSTQMLQNFIQQGAFGTDMAATLALLQTQFQSIANVNSNVQANPNIWTLPMQSSMGNILPNPAMMNMSNEQDNGRSLGSYQDKPDQSSDDYSHYYNRDDGRRSREDMNVSQTKLTTSDMLLFKNLPASVTADVLITKMREVGELKFAEQTGQGKAIVRFVHTRDAERCVNLFNRSKVDGQIIEVKYF